MIGLIFRNGAGCWDGILRREGCFDGIVAGRRSGKGTADGGLERGKSGLEG